MYVNVIIEAPPRLSTSMNFGTKANVWIGPNCSIFHSQFTLPNPTRRDWTVEAGGVNWA